MLFLLMRITQLNIVRTILKYHNQLELMQFNFSGLAVCAAIYISKEFTTFEVPKDIACDHFKPLNTYWIMVI